MILKPGTRIMFRDGRHGVIEKHLGRHNGYRVRLDERRQFEGETVRAQGCDLTPTNPKLHAEWEGGWPSFTRKERGWAKSA
jgi:hypothetical protein